MYDGNTEVCYLGIVFFGKFPDPGGFQCWRVNFKTAVCVSTSTLELTMSWINEVEMSGSVDDLMTSQSIKGKCSPYFEVLDARIASALEKDCLQHFFQKKSQC